MKPQKTINAENRKPYSGKGISVFAKKFQQRRMELGLSQAALGRILGMAPSRISEIEAGRFPSDPDRLVAISDALKCDISWLFNIEGAPEPLPHILFEVTSDIERLLEQAREKFGPKGSCVGDEAKEVVKFFWVNLHMMIDDWKEQFPYSITQKHVAPDSSKPE